MSQIGLLDGLATTRAIRRFRPEPVPTEDLSAILFAATRAPSGSNRQPVRFLVLRDGPTAAIAKELLSSAFAEAWESKSAAEGYREAGSESPRGRLKAAMADMIDRFADIPVVVLVCTTPRHHTLIDGASVYPACQNLLLAARALGYGGVLTGWHSTVEEQLKELCGIPDDVVIAATIPLGVPEGRHGPVRRRPLADSVYEDRWDVRASWPTDPAGTRFAS
ncbi:MAG: nitroreductase family protein [Acidimicrobiales bacterium]